jgi:glutathione peroxidase
MGVYETKARSIEGKDVDFASFRGKVLIVVNTASKCGFTPQYEGLEALYKKYKDQGLEILGFPSNQFGEQEPGANAEVKEFCKVRYGVSFPLFEKTDVRGSSAHPLFAELSEKARFQGFDKAHPVAAPLEAILKEKFPSYLEGNGVKWNFTKFVINRQGQVVSRYEPTSEPSAMEEEIQALLA